MSSNWFTRWFRGTSAPNRGARRGIRRRARLEVQHLEDRALPSTVTWDGGGTTNNWSEGRNWSRDVAPVAGDDVVFPTSSANPTSFYNLAGGTRINSITFTGSGYTISGANVLDLGAGGTLSSASSGINRFTGPIQFAAVRTIDVASGGSLELTGVLSGSGAFDKTGDGTLTLNGPDANTYTGLTKFEGGVLLLDKGPANGWSIAIPGDFDIQGAGSKIDVKLARDNQIDDNSTVFVTRTANGGATFSLNGFNDTIGGLKMTGGVVDTRRFDAQGRFVSQGILTLNGDVTAQADTNLFANSIILGRIAWDSTCTFTVNDAPGSDIDLVISAEIGGDVLRKEGHGQLRFENAPHQLEINSGTVIFFGSGLAGGVSLRNDGLLTTDASPLVSSARFTGPISTHGGLASTLDETRATFTPATIWDRRSGTGFGDTITYAGPASASGSTTASWVFTGLPPGFYRVFATWPASAANSTKAPYSIFEGSALRATGLVNQELHPTGGPEEDGHDFQQLADVVPIRFGTLKVQLTNQVPTETDGANVIADAIRIERLAGVLNLTGLSRAGDVTLGIGSTYQVDLSSFHRLDASGSFVSSGALLSLKADSFTAPAVGTTYRIVNNGIGSPGTFSNAPDNLDTVDLLAGGQRHIFSVNYAAGDGNDVELIYKNTGTQVSDLTLSPDVINEGERVTLRGALTDPNKGDVLSLRVDWGDGTVQTFTDLDTKPFRFTHTYADNSPHGSPYLVRVEWFDQHGDGNFRKLFVTVNSVPPRLFLGGAVVVYAGEVMSHIGRFTDPGRDTWTATVDYGDGSGTQPLAIPPGQRLVFENHYQEPGSYHVTVTVTDDDGGVTTDDFLVIVQPLPGTRGRGKHRS